VGKAARRLARDQAEALTDNQVALLRSLHPDAPCPVFEAPPPTFLVPFTPKDVREVLSNCCNGVAPGPTGWTEELLLDAMHDENAALDLCAFLTDVANGRVDPSVAERLTRSWLVGIGKPNDPHGVRPIAMGDVFLKVASRVAMQHALSQITRAFEGVQYGVLHKNGAEKIVHWTRAHVRGHPGRVVVTLDFANAFNTPLRVDMQRAVSSLCPAMQGVFYTEYAKPADLLFRRLHASTEVLRSSRGSRQGSAAGPLFFSLTLQHCLEEATAIEGVRVLAFMDDITILANDAPSAARAVHLIVSNAARIGLQVNSKKCSWLSVCDPPDGMCARFIRDTRCTRVLGAFVGVTDADEGKSLRSALSGRDKVFFDRLALLPEAAGSLMLSASGVVRVNYIARTHAPSATEEAVAARDLQVERVWSGWSGVVPDDRCRKLAHLPKKKGGCGFTRYAYLASAAYAASSSAAFELDGVRDQSTLTYDINCKIEAELKANPVVAQHLAMTSLKGAASWMCTPQEKNSVIASQETTPSQQQRTTCFELICSSILLTHLLQHTSGI